MDSGSVNQIQQQLGANHQRIISNDDLTALEQALNPDITQYNIDQMLLRKAKGNTNSFVIAYGNLLDQLNGSYKIIGQPQPSITPGLDSLEAGIVVANKLTSLLETTYSVPPSLKSDIAFIIDGIIQVQTLPIGAYPEVKDIATLKALLLDQAAQTPPENDNQ
ncbi:MAG: hypothetical protein Q8O99_07025 [bacterium]|nr:hypothetical protein [bacterium]